MMDYIPWLWQQLQNEENSILKRLADGPRFESISYNAYMINGYAFYTTDVEMNKTTQNSRVSLRALTSCRSSAKDTNLVHEVFDYYGIIKKIIEIDYYDFK